MLDDASEQPLFMKPHRRTNTGLRLDLGFEDNRKRQPSCQY
jgi:hypothetical protein